MLWAATYNVPPQTPALPLLLAADESVLVSGTLSAVGVPATIVLTAGNEITINPNGEISETSGTIALQSDSTSGTTGIINIKANALLSASSSAMSAIEINNNYNVNILNEGDIFGNIVFANPGINVTTVLEGGTLTGDVSGFSGTLNLDGINPVTGSIVGEAASSNILNLGYNRGTSYTTGGTISNVASINFIYGTLTTTANITDVNTAFNINHGAFAYFNNTISGSGSFTNSGHIYLEDAASNITGFSNFTNAGGAYVNLEIAGALDLASIVNNGTMDVSADFAPTLLRNGAQNAAILNLTANLTTTGGDLINGDSSKKSLITIADGVSVDVGATRDIINLKNSEISIAGEVNFTSKLLDNQGILSVNIVDDANYATLTVSGAIDLANSTLRVNTYFGDNATAPTTFSAVLTSTGSNVTLPKTVDVRGNIFSSWSAVASEDGDAIDLIYTRRGFNFAEVSTWQKGIANALEYFALNSETDELALIDAIEATVTDYATYADLLQTLSPLAINNTISHVQHQTMNQVLTRIASVASSSMLASNSLYNYQASATDNNFWLRPYFNHLRQNKNLSKGQIGYKNDTYGAIFGVDSESWGRKHLIGCAASYAFSHVDKYLNDKSNAKSHSYGVMFYGRYQYHTPVFFDWVAGAGLSNTKQERHINIGAINELAKASINSSQYSIRGAIGYFGFKEKLINFTPDVALQYVYVKNNDYSESDASLNALTVKPRDNNVLTLSPGFIMHINSKQYKQESEFAIMARLNYTPVGSSLESESYFTNSSAPGFTSTTTSQKLTFNTGVSFGLRLSDFELEAAYYYEFASGYRDSQLYLNFKFPF